MEDDEAVVDIVALALQSRGYEIVVARSGREALDRASVTEPDVIVLDLGLPDIDGVDVCRELRRWFRNPIIVLSADGDGERKVMALDEGADDYVTKPYAVPELLARIRVAQRHRAVLGAVVDPQVITVGDLVLDTAAHQASVAGRPVDLSAKEFALVALLARNRGKLVSHNALLTAVWQSQDKAKLATLRTHVNQVRRKLGTDPATPQIEGEAGVGYRLTSLT